MKTSKTVFALFALVGLTTGVASAADKPEDFTADGVTGVFADNQLTITVDSGKTCTYNYADKITTGWVTNVVKKGAGALTTVAAAAYQGSFDFQEGSVTIGGAGHLGADNVGIVRKASGVTMTMAAGSAKGKKMYLAGTVTQSASATALNACDVVLTGNLKWTRAGSYNFATGSQIDMNGKVLTLDQTTGWGGDVQIGGVTFTNSSTTASSITMTWWATLYLYDGTSFWGGSANKLTTCGNYADDSVKTHFKGRIGGDWTIVSQDKIFYPQTTGRSSNSLDDRIDCTLKTGKDQTKYNSQTDGCITLGGPLAGTIGMNVRGGTLNFLNAANTYNGVLSLTDATSSKLRSCIYVWNGANFSAKSVSLYNADIWMDDNTAFAFPAITLGNGSKAANCCTISGGPTGDKACGRATIAGFTKSGGKTLTVDSPVHITGTTLVSTNTLALGSGTTANELPVFDHLSFAKDTKFDMNGKDLTIGSLTGIPTVTNPGTLTITGTWTVNGDALADGAVLDLGAGKLVLTSTATINVVKGAKDVPRTPVVVAAGGIEDSSTGDWRLSPDGILKAKVAITVVGGGTTDPALVYALPGETVTVTAAPAAGNFVVWSGDVTAIQSEGHNVFDNAITLKVGDSTALTATFADLAAARPTDFSETGVTGAFADRQLTITIEANKTNTYNYAADISTGWVTNVIKKGAGVLKTVAATGYCGAFDFQEGKSIIAGAGHLGADNVGIVRKAKAVVMSIGAGAAKGKKMYLAGSVGQSSNATALNACDVVLTDNLSWSNGSYYYFMTGSRVDMNGKSMSISAGGWGYAYVSGVTFTNSSATASTITCEWWGKLYISGGTSFWGGSNNRLVMSSNYADPAPDRYTGVIGGDWTIRCNSERFYVDTSSGSTNTLANRIDCTFEVGAVSGGLTKYNYDSTKTSCLTFGGPVTGTSAMDVRGGTLNFLNAANTYNGNLTMTDQCTPYLRACIYVWNGANFSAKSVTLKNADIWMDDNTAFAFPAITLDNGTKAANCCTISGGPTGDKACGRATVAGFTKSGGKTLTVDSPVHITGTTLVSTNTLALGSGTTANELPVFDHLSFANGTTFDMNGKDLTIGNLTGIPTVTNPGTLTITGNWTVSGDALVDGGKLNLGAGTLAFGPGATITIVKGTKTVPHEVAVAVAQGGITGSPTAGAGGVRRDFKIAQSGTELRAAAFGLMLYVR